MATVQMLLAVLIIIIVKLMREKLKEQNRKLRVLQNLLFLPKFPQVNKQSPDLGSDSSNPRIVKAFVINAPQTLGTHLRKYPHTWLLSFLSEVRVFARADPGWSLPDPEPSPLLEPPGEDVTVSWPRLAICGCLADAGSLAPTLLSSGLLSWKHFKGWF